MRTNRLMALVVVIFIFTAAAQAVTIDLVPVGNPGNAPDTRYDATGFGSVAYNYQIGKYEVTAGQYTEFLNAVAKADPNGLYNTGRWAIHPISSGVRNIQRSGSSGNYSYSVAADWANRPVNYVSFWDAARFANWLHNGQPTARKVREPPRTAPITTSTTRRCLAVTPVRDSSFRPKTNGTKRPTTRMTALTGNYWDYPTASEHSAW